MVARIPPWRDRPTDSLGFKRSPDTRWRRCGWIALAISREHARKRSLHGYRIRKRNASHDLVGTGELIAPDSNPSPAGDRAIGGYLEDPCKRGDDGVHVLSGGELAEREPHIGAGPLRIEVAEDV